MRSIFIIFYLLVFTLPLMAQQNYDASLISKDLLPYASAVVRNKEVTIEVKDFDNTIYHIKEAITVLNKNGDEAARIVVEHDKANVIKNIKGVAYDEFGKQIKKFSESDFDDVNAWDGFSLFTDAKLKHFLPAISQYPYTIAYEYEERSKQSLYFSDWKPNPTPGVAVEKSSFTFSCRPAFNIRYKENNISSKLRVGINTQGQTTYTWEVNNLKALRSEPYSPYDERYLSSVKIAPEKFTYYGMSGSFNNWQQLGKWEYEKLVANRQQLPPETIEHIKEMTKGIADTKLKAKKIYEYMQDKTHYISVQVGIGGYQPFVASDVDKQNYGDCKALVNYTQALLKAVNIESYYCVVEAGRKFNVGMLNDFPSMNQGNHIILCLPFKNDTTWADCTSQTIPFGYLGDFTDDRNVLACTPEGGKLMHTPKYTALNSITKSKANFSINETGVLSGNITTTFKGADYSDRDYLLKESRLEQNKMTQKTYPINNMVVENLELKQDKSFDPVTTENLKLRAADYAATSSGKFYFILNAVNRVSGPPRQVRNRLNDVYINRGHTDEDDITYTIPEGYRLEHSPLFSALNKPFGKYTATMILKGNEIIYKRRFQLFGGTYSKDNYQDLVDFYQAVYDADNYTVVLVKNDQK